MQQTKVLRFPVQVPEAERMRLYRDDPLHNPKPCGVSRPRSAFQTPKKWIPRMASYGSLASVKTA
jgi:hypothetical protein